MRLRIACVVHTPLSAGAAADSARRLGGGSASSTRARFGDGRGSPAGSSSACGGNHRRWTNPRRRDSMPRPPRRRAPAPARLRERPPRTAGTGWMGGTWPAGVTSGASWRGVLPDRSRPRPPEPPSPLVASHSAPATLVSVLRRPRHLSSMSRSHHSLRFSAILSALLDLTHTHNPFWRPHLMRTCAAVTECFWR